MLEERLKPYLTLVSRYRKALTETSRGVIVDELKQLHNTTSTTCVRTRASVFLSSIGAWGSTG